MEALCPNTGENYVLLDFLQFCEEVRERVISQLGEPYEATIRKVVKNNQTEHRTIVIREGGDEIMPSIYLETFYEEYSHGMKMEEIVESVLRVYRENRNPWPEGIDLSFEGLKEKIGFRVVNYERNRETLEGMPFLRIEDWAVCFECVLSRENGQVGAFRIDYTTMANWKIGLKELTELASENSFGMFPSKLEPIEEVLAGMLISRIEEDRSLSREEREQKTKEVIDGVLSRRDECGLPMYVLSNAMNHFGASAILNIPFMDKVREKLKEDFFILPSSVHELILIPVSCAPDEEKLLRMVHDVNEREVPEEEYLSDGVYRYRAMREKILTALSEAVSKES
ncbi:MAG: hypothetical protein J5872_01940 [Lachnospiraceae bacterium]|nr:hypothetical protein [Lachnospiraceae bacterium]